MRAQLFTLAMVTVALSGNSRRAAAQGPEINTRDSARTHQAVFKAADAAGPGVYTPEPFTISVGGYPSTWYWLRVYQEGGDPKRSQEVSRMPMLLMQARLP
jgi:hypothetical protein